ncbi:hypothetical protein ILUMI_05960 [Ignelater luminosus]|uniref:Uncharacterized protein n=1 Tax=Ignelater luminosus TaxID=2038154 RepID=A0A8K0GD26_IGNLU|nr:hypothetical protein ILUMI_05960 [Ignelater luminosus]
MIKSCTDRKKSKYLEERIEEIERYHKNKEVRNFYQGTKKLKAGYQTRTIDLETDSEGRIVDNYNINRAWKDYFRKLLNGEEDSKKGQTQAHMQERNEDEEEMSHRTWKNYDQL